MATREELAQEYGARAQAAYERVARLERELEEAEQEAADAETVADLLAGESSREVADAALALRRAGLTCAVDDAGEVYVYGPADEAVWAATYQQAWQGAQARGWLAAAGVGLDGLGGALDETDETDVLALLERTTARVLRWYDEAAGRVATGQEG